MSYHLFDQRRLTEIVQFVDVMTGSKVMQFANMMAKSQYAIPAYLRNNPADCLHIILKAAQFQMNPYDLAQKTHEVQGKIGYEAQLICALVQNSTAIEGTLRYQTKGHWEQWQPQNTASERGLMVRVGAILKGDKEVTWAEWLCLSRVDARRSPLWKTHPHQQLCYLAMKQWVRLYAPQIMMGIYDPEELDSKGLGAVSKETPATPSKAQQPESKEASQKPSAAPGKTQESESRETLRQRSTTPSKTHRPGSRYAVRQHPTTPSKAQQPESEEASQKPSAAPSKTQESGSRETSQKPSAAPSKTQKPEISQTRGQRLADYEQWLEGRKTRILAEGERRRQQVEAQRTVMVSPGSQGNGLASHPRLSSAFEVLMKKSYHINSPEDYRKWVSATQLASHKEAVTHREVRALRERITQIKSHLISLR